jgi:hypothetical protein
VRIDNFTPFVPMVLACADVGDRLFGVLALKGTFAIVPGQPLVPEAAQAPFVTDDAFHGDPARSSLRRESDLAPFKPRADVHVHAVARAPGGWATPRWQVRVKVGVLEKTLSVCGPRRWVREGSAYRLTDPEACTDVPLVYERSFGGGSVDAWGEPETFHENPSGSGYLREGSAATEPSVWAPQIEAPDAPVTTMGPEGRAEGLGPIARAWMPRRARAGTYDDVWLRERWPSLPRDFDFGFYNSAHPDLIYPGYLRGDEHVELEGVDPHGPLRFSLPAEEVAALVDLRDGSKLPVRLAIDTLVADLLDARVYLTWRTLVPPVDRMRSIEVRMRRTV